MKEKEIARTQLWQWVKHKAELSDGREITADLFKQIRSEELEKIKKEIGEGAYKSSKFKQASEFLEGIVLNAEFPEFLTLGAYEILAD